MVKSAHFRGGLVRATKRYVMHKHILTLRRKTRLQRELLDLEKQLKQHPLGAIILKAKIKQKRMEIETLNVKKFSRGKADGSSLDRGNGNRKLNSFRKGYQNVFHNFE